MGKDSSAQEASIGRRPRALAWLQSTFAAVLIGPALLLAYVAWDSYVASTAAARARLARLTQIAQEQSLRIVETNEVISRGIVNLTGADTNDALRSRSADLHAGIKALVAGVKQVQSVWIWDERGRPIATNLLPQPPATLDVSDREYFRWARDRDSEEWFVSAPLRSRTTGELFFDFSKRRTLEQRFAGALSVSLRPTYFDEFFREQVAGEPGVTLSLLRSDGTFISRFPPAPAGDAARLGSSSPLLAAMNSGRPEGQVEGVSSVDGEYRYVAFRRIGALPLYVASTGSRSALVKPWFRSIGLLVAFTLPLSLGMAALCGFAISRVRREHAIAVEHQEQYAQRLKAEEALRQAQKLEALGRLTGGVAHDFNNVLMVVQTSVALARGLAARGQPLDKALAPIERAVANGAQLTRQLLAVVRRQPLQVRTVPLPDVIGPLAQLMQTTLGRAIRVRHDVQTTLHVTVDEAELELALINLCLNARDAMPDGGLVTVSAREAAPPADVVPSTPWVRITVSDTGEGIPEELLARVTEPFFTTKPLGKGTGLGLSQVQSFVTQAGGRMELRSELGRGTEVSLLLPSTIAVAPTPDVAKAASALKLSGSVLLVEDNPDISQTVTAILQDVGATVVSCTDVDQALRRLHEAPFDFVLSDVNLPGDKSGIDLARWLRKARPRQPLVLMTGYTDQLQEAVAAGFRVLAKPATPESLIDALHAARVSQNAV